MSYNTNSKVNPFFIQDDEEDPWDDDDEEEDYNDEQVMLISGSGSNTNRSYNVPSTFSNSISSGIRQRSAPFGRSQDGMHDFHKRNRQHRPQLWKYGIIFLTVVMVVVFRTDQKASTSGGDKDYASLVKKKITGDNDGYRIVVLGERHSGVKWTRDRLRECFPKMDVSTNLQRLGYFFQDDEVTARSKNDQLLGTSSQETSPEKENYQDTIVVHVTLNAYDWLEQMRLSPEYAPDHTGTHEELGHVVPLGWEEFLSKPWTMERPQTDFPLLNETGPVCKMGFHYHEVVSCSGLASGIGDPMYELQRGKEGLPFESIIDLRTAKLKNHHGVQESWPSVKKMTRVKYETLAQDFTKLIEEIQDFTGDLTGWDDGENQNEGVSKLSCVNALPPPLDSSKGMTREFVDYVNKLVDWEIEESIASYAIWTEDEVNAKDIRPAVAPTPSRPIVEEESATDTNEGIAEEKDSLNEEDPDDENEKTQEENEAVETVEEAVPPPSNQSSETIIETNMEDGQKETEGNNEELENSEANTGTVDDVVDKATSDSTINNSPSISTPVTQKDSIGDDENYQTIIPVVEDEEDLLPPPTKAELSDKENELAKTSGVESNDEDMTPDTTDAVSQDSLTAAQKASNEEGEASSMKNVDGNEGKQEDVPKSPSGFISKDKKYDKVIDNEKENILDAKEEEAEVVDNVKRNSNDQEKEREKTKDQKGNTSKDDDESEMTFKDKDNVGKNDDKENGSGMNEEMEAKDNGNNVNNTSKNPENEKGKEDKVNKPDVSKEKEDKTNGNSNNDKNTSNNPGKEKIKKNKENNTDVSIENEDKTDGNGNNDKNASNNPGKKNRENNPDVSKEKEGKDDGYDKNASNITADKCTNDPNYTTIGGQDQHNCVWIGRAPGFRCQKPGAVDGCPAFCNPDCDDESDRSLNQNLEKTVNKGDSKRRRSTHRTQK